MCSFSLNGATFVGWNSEKLAKSSQPIPNSFWWDQHLPYWKNSLAIIPMRFCNQWKSQGEICPPTCQRSPPQSGYLQKVAVEGMEQPACSPELNHTENLRAQPGCPVCQRPTQPYWLTCDKCWLKNVMLFHNSV
ncbi:hypothetical protein XENORESO_007475 [Xenotaenia resolanae]|uniref:Uncharacterized protein n=1 Tax=Xenotaenia resolanae TaxID=208358 RepID=A0ABV0W065_9TELE